MGYNFGKELFMRRTGFLIVIIGIIYCLPLFSTSVTEPVPAYKHEIQFKWGPAPTLPLAVGVYVLSTTDPFPLELLGFLAIPAFSGEYLYNLTPRHAIGASVNFFLILPSAMFKYRFTYTQSPGIRMYGSVGVGFGTYNIYPGPAIQLTPFGIQFDIKKGFFVMETGVGMEGSLLILGGGFRF